MSGLNLNLIHSAVDASNIEECSTDLYSDPCQHQSCNNHGDCRPTSDGRHFECHCHSGYRLVTKPIYNTKFFSIKSQLIFLRCDLCTVLKSSCIMVLKIFN